MKIEILIVIVKGWMLMQYYIFSKIIKINIGVQVHINLWVTSYCKDVWSQNVLNSRIR